MADGFTIIPGNPLQIVGTALMLSKLAQALQLAADTGSAQVLEDDTVKMSIVCEKDWKPR